MLGSLEAKVLGVLEDEEEASVREVVDGLEERGEDKAYTTVGTILDRLYEKDIIERREEPYKGGSRYVYEYVDFEEDYLNEILRDVVDLFGCEGIDSLHEKISEKKGEEICNGESDTDTDEDPKEKSPTGETSD
ncbi:MAG: BlaI/MecI/CopY family transcriptional regulator [Halobacteria archaeon]|nr:BlaI/MecI/CopY family transcriptional regulator [Halobacteria archaeon]